MDSTLQVSKTDFFEIDGNADKSVWKNAQDLVFCDAVTGEEIEKNQAKAKMLWSEKGLFILWEVQDEHIWGTYKNDDDPIYNEEVVEIFIAQSKDVPRNYFEFQFSPLGVKFDAKISNPTGSRHDKEFNVDTNWDCAGLQYKVAALSNPSGHHKIASGIWIVEAFIPFKSIGIDKVTKGDIFRANLFRIDGYPKQNSFQAWQPTLEDPPNFHVPDKFGFLELV